MYSCVCLYVSLSFLDVCKCFASIRALSASSSYIMCKDFYHLYKTLIGISVSLNGHSGKHSRCHECHWSLINTGAVFFIYASLRLFSTSSCPTFSASPCSADRIIDWEHGKWETRRRIKKKEKDVQEKESQKRGGYGQRMGSGEVVDERMC